MKTRNDVYTRQNQYDRYAVGKALALDAFYLAHNDTRDTIPDAPLYVLGTDPFFAGLHKATDITVVPCASGWEAEQVMKMFAEPGWNLKRVRLVVNKPRQKKNVRYANCMALRFRALDIPTGSADNADVYDVTQQAETTRPGYEAPYLGTLVKTDSDGKRTDFAYDTVWSAKEYIRDEAMKRCGGTWKDCAERYYNIFAIRYGVSFAGGDTYTWEVDPASGKTGLETE